MDRQLAAAILTGDSEEIADLKANLDLLEGFINLAREIDNLPEISKRFYENSRSLFQVTSSNRAISELETLLGKFFGPPVKPAGQPSPRKLRKTPAVKYLGGIEKDQSFFVLPLKTGEFYGALWPWRSNKSQIEIHLGYCSDWMTEEDYQQLETLVKRSLSHSAFQRMDTGLGGRIRGIGLPSFLQMAEMEQATFTLHIVAGDQRGLLHVKEGRLIAAETDELAGPPAAHRIISWHNAIIEIAPAVPDQTDQINLPLMHILMESLKIRDEDAATADSPPRQKPKPRRPKAAEVREFKRLVRLERAPAPRLPRQKVRWTKVIAAALGFSIFAACAWMTVWYFLSTRGTNLDGYQQALAQVEKIEDQEKKIQTLNSFLQNNPHSGHTAEINSEIAKIRGRMEETELERITLQISNLPINEEYEAKAIALYSDFQEKYPNSLFQERITESVREIKHLLDQYYYDELLQAARLDFSRRLQVYKGYLQRFPKGRYQRDVELLIESMGRQHLEFLKGENERCEQHQGWDACLTRYDQFIEDFKNTPLGEQAAGLRTVLQEQKELAHLKRSASEAGNDYAKAQLIYRRYLEENPNCSQKALITKEMARLEKNLHLQQQWKAVQSYALNSQVALFVRIEHLDRYLREHLSGPYAGEAQELMNQLEKQRLAELRHSQLAARKQKEQARIQSELEQKARQQQRMEQIRHQLETQLSASKRYKLNGDGTVTDRTSGLTWALLDSSQETGGCLTFAGAQQYVQSLSSRLKGVWRLPTAGELAGICKQTPFFPESGAEWYWSSEASARGYYTVVDVVTAKPETVFKREYRRQEECGAVRAVH